MSLRTRPGLALFAVTMMVAVACQAAPVASPTGPASTPAGGTTTQPATPGDSPADSPDATTGAASPAASPTGSPAGSPSETAGQSPTGEQTLRYVIDGEITFLSNALADVPTAEAAQWLHSALYTYNEALEPVPDLAADMPVISEDGRTWTVTLRDDAVFQGPPGTPGVGEPVTADDVVFTYEMSNNPNCRFNPSVCLGNVVVAPPGDPDAEPVQVLKSVRAVDDQTVEFVLNFPYAPFMTTSLPGHLIDSRAAVEASFAEFEEGSQNVTVDEVTDLSDRFAAEAETPTGPPDEEGNPTPNLAQFRAEAEEILGRAGVELPNEAAYPNAEGTGTDEEAFAGALQTLIDDLRLTLESDAADRIAAAYTLLDIQRQPVGAGPFYLTEFNAGENLVYARNEQYHHGTPQISQMFLPIIKDAVAATSALVAGDVDWVYSVEADQFATIQNNPEVKYAEYADFSYFGVQFNLREGRLFAEKEMRQAAAFCIPKEDMVDAATAGQAVTIHADLPPASWAYNPDVRIYEHDPAQGNALIEGLGYTKGADGVYERDGKRLETTILVRAGKPDRIAFMQFFAD
ncbi:MAG TPA: ABC transporter substrate-binding protein, partial [Candidatus Caenarcaniphilales bacterium]|nr:ABC transporter substrate-binding protein [Candidatus Caenarcaniphilales bacterium]